MPEAAKILVIRFSAMGDVAMSAPVIKQFEERYSGIPLLVVSRSQFKPFFANTNAAFHHFEPKGKHRGFLGLIKLFFELRRENITMVADLHNNLRSTIITCLFFLTGIRTATLDKGRKEKKLLTRKNNKQLIPLKPTVQRYADVFKRLGFPLEINNTLHPEKKVDRQQKWIGVSPFAQHLQKVYPAEKMESVICELANLGHLIYIFGGSEEEQATAEAWAAKHPNIYSLVRKMSLPEELEFIAQLDVMLSMDSSGMHMASLKNIPVVSIWGATHPYLGFLGYGQSITNAVQIDLYCRPCSVYGNVPCYRGDLACMNKLPARVVVEKVLNELNK